MPEYQANPDVEYTTDIRDLLATVWRWAWLLALGLVLGIAAGYIYSILQKPVYQATTKVLVTRTGQAQSTDISGTMNLQQLTDTYVQFLTMDSTLDLVSKDVGSPVSAGQVHANQVGNTQIINISVNDMDPKQAARIADALVQILISQNDTLQSSRYSDNEAALQAQVTDLEENIAFLQEQLDKANAAAVKKQIQRIQEQIAETQKEIDTLVKSAVPSDQARLSQLRALRNSYQDAYINLVVSQQVPNDDQVNRLQKTINLYQQIYLNLLTNLQNVRLAQVQDTPNVVQVGHAKVPGQPVFPKPLQNSGIGALAGLFLASMAVFVIEFFDDTFKSPEDVQKSLGLSVLGFIAEFGPTEKDREGLYVTHHPRSPITEAFRSLRTNLEFAGINQPLAILLVTSTGPGEGKSTVASNLAAIISQGGKQVILIDADLHRPVIHRYFGLANHIGLTDILREKVDLQEASHSPDGFDKLKIITTGGLPPNPAEVLDSEKMTGVLTELKKHNDMVLLDTPPSIVTDAQVLSAKADGVLLVIHPGKTLRKDAMAAIEQFKRSKARVVGVVFNRIPLKRGSFYGGNRQYSPYFSRGYGYYSETNPVPEPSAETGTAE